MTRRYTGLRPRRNPEQDPALALAAAGTRPAAQPGTDDSVVLGYENPVFPAPTPEDDVVDYRAGDAAPVYRPDPLPDLGPRPRLSHAPLAPRDTAREGSQTRKQGGLAALLGLIFSRGNPRAALAAFSGTGRGMMAAQDEAEAEREKVYASELDVKRQEQSDDLAERNEALSRWAAGNQEKFRAYQGQQQSWNQVQLAERNRLMLAARAAEADAKRKADEESGRRKQKQAEIDDLRKQYNATLQQNAGQPTPIQRERVAWIVRRLRALGETGLPVPGDPIGPERWETKNEPLTQGIPDFFGLLQPLTKTTVPLPRRQEPQRFTVPLSPVQETQRQQAEATRDYYRKLPGLNAAKVETDAERWAATHGETVRSHKAQEALEAARIETARRAAALAASRKAGAAKDPALDRRKRGMAQVDKMADERYKLDTTIDTLVRLIESGVDDNGDALLDKEGAETGRSKLLRAQLEGLRTQRANVQRRIDQRKREMGITAPPAPGPKNPPLFNRRPTELEEWGAQPGNVPGNLVPIPASGGMGKIGAVLPARRRFADRSDEDLTALFLS